AEGKFKEVSEAYEVLSDEEKRVLYDKFGSDWQHAQQTGGTGGFDWSRYQQQGNGGQQQYTDSTAEDRQDIFGEEGNFSDFFETLCGKARDGSRTGTQRGPTRGRDAETPLQITLEEAYHGTSRLVTRSGREVEGKIPAGVRTGSRVKLAGQGAPGRNGGQPGDLYLDIEVAPHERFERRDDDLYTEFDGPLYTAILSGKGEVQTMDGPVQLAIPAGTQNGRLFRIRGKGMPKLRNPSEHGDLFAKANVRLPTKLTPEQRKLFEQLRDSSL